MKVLKNILRFLSAIARFLSGIDKQACDACHGCCDRTQHHHPDAVTEPTAEPSEPLRSGNDGE